MRLKSFAGRRAHWIIALLLVAPLPTRAAPATEMDTLISGDLENGGYGGPSATYTRIVGTDVLMVGGRGAWLIDHRFALGGAVQGLIPIGAPYTASSGRQYDLRMGYGGLWLEYTLFPERMVHGSFGSILGLGWLNLEGGGGPGRGAPRTDLIVAIEPTAMAEVNMTSFFRLGAGVSYRYVGGVDFEGLESSELRGFGGNVVLKFGRF